MVVVLEGNFFGGADFFTQIRVKNGHTLAVIKHPTRNISNSDMAHVSWLNCELWFQFLEVLMQVPFNIMWNFDAVKAFLSWPNSFL